MYDTNTFQRVLTTKPSGLVRTGKRTRGMFVARWLGPAPEMSLGAEGAALLLTDHI